MKTPTDPDPDPDRWTPVKRGPIFCSPGCGMGCTHAAFLDAHTNAKALCATLNRTSGEGWTPHVWENLGWHYCAHSVCGRIKVHPETCPPKGGPRYYHAFLGEAGSAGGRWVEDSKTASAAVRKVIAAFREEMAPMVTLYHEPLGGEVTSLLAKRPQLRLTA